MKTYRLDVLIYMEGNLTQSVPLTVPAEDESQARREALELLWSQKFLVRSFKSIRKIKEPKR